MAVTLDLTPDSCRIIVACNAEDANALGGSIASVNLEDCDGVMIALIGIPWDSNWPDSVNDRIFDYALKQVEIDLDLAGLPWTEV